MRFFAVLLLAACTCGNRLIPTEDAGEPPDAGPAFDGGIPDRDGGRPNDAGPPPDARLIPDAACASSSATATLERLPVDIIWMVDNSTSMQPAIEQVQMGLNDFAALIETRGLDYRVIMLSLRGEGRGTLANCDTSNCERFRVCIPPPLSSDTRCGDGPRFFQVELDVRSTQPIEQFLGTLGQTTGYLATDSRGSGPWRDLLRPEATKTIVIVTDDNARTCALPGSMATCTASDPPLTATSLEDFPGGGNPFSSRELGPGILTAAYGTLFDGYIFSALYGWGSETDPTVRCTYPGGTMPPASGQTYTELVARTGGARAQICDGAAAWGPFFTDVASAVERGTRIECNIDIPPPPDGSFFDRDLINVFVDVGAGQERVGYSRDAAGCGAGGGWYYDDDAAPTQVILCPATCDRLQSASGTTRSVDVQFGCNTIPI